MDKEDPRMGSKGPGETSGGSSFEQAMFSIAEAEVIDGGYSCCAQSNYQRQVDPGTESGDMEEDEQEQVAEQEYAGIENVLCLQAAKQDGLIDALVNEIDTCSHIIYF